MAFNEQEFLNKYSNTKNATTNKFDEASFVNKYTNKNVATSSFNQDNFLKKYNIGGDTKSSTGLYQIASQSGLQAQADEILKKQTGENTKEIFSGGFISDTFDVLNAMQYGVVGLLKGKSFLEGVKTRQSFTDKDALGDKGIPGMIAGIALDIAVDPLTYVAPATIVKKVPLLSKALNLAKTATFGKKVTKAIEGTEKTYEALEGGTKAGKYLASKFSWMFGADPVFRETFERGTKNIALETQNIVDLTKGVSKIEPEVAAKILSKDDTGRFIRQPLETLEKELTPEQFGSVSELYTKLDNLGKEAVDLGLLSKEKYEENLGEYIKNAYTEYETAKSKGLFGFAKTSIKGIKNRKDLSPEDLEKLGQISDPAYLLFKSNVDLMRDVENAKMFRSIAEKFGTEVAQDGFTQLPKGARLGDLAGKYVPDNIHFYLTELTQPTTNTLQKQLVGNFKFFKVVMNPGTHARNIVSNQLLNWWKLGMNPLDPRSINANRIALAEIAKGTGRYTEEAKKLGYNLDTFASAEMKSILEAPETANAMKKAGGLWKTTKKKLGDLYQAEENQAKLSAYIFNRKKGMKQVDAWKAAESATFNYAQVTPFVRKLRESVFGMPFITFTVKSTPVVAETMYKYPRRISAIGKIKQGIEQQADLKETERERKNEPAWVKDGFYIKLPMKDKQGRSAYFDLTYILPFGDLMAGNFLERSVNMQTGLPESYASATLKKSPFIQLISELGKNQDYYGNKIWRDSDSSEKQLGDLMRHLTKTYAPPLIGDQIPGGYNKNGEKTQRGIIGAVTPQDKENQQRTLAQELMRMVGAKIQPIDADVQENYTEWNKRKALENLLIENGKLDELRTVYKPKE